MKLEFEVRDHGVEHSQYFPGCGVYGTRYSDVATGIGESAREAGIDAFEGADIPTNVDASELIREIASLPDKADAHEACEREWQREADAIDDAGESGQVPWEAWHEGCELWHFVSIRWRVAESDEVRP